MAFSPVHRVFRISFRIVRDLPYAVVLGAVFLKEHQSPSASERRKVSDPHLNQLGCFFPRIPPTRRRHRRTSPLLELYSAPSADNDPNLEGPRHVIPKNLAEASKDSLDQVVNHLLSTCGIIK